MYLAAFELATVRAEIDFDFVLLRLMYPSSALEGRGNKDHMTRNQGKRKQKAGEQANLKARMVKAMKKRNKGSLPAASSVCADGSLTMAVPAGGPRIGRPRTKDIDRRPKTKTETETGTWIKTT